MKIYMVLLLIASVCLAAPAASQEAPTDTARQHRVDKFLQKDPNPGDGDGGCQVCEFNLSTNTISCAPVLSGDSGHTKCKITVSATEVVCETSGSFCSVSLVNP